MNRIIFFIVITCIMLSCSNRKAPSVSFKIGQVNKSAKILVAYTDDPLVKWNDEAWVKIVKSKMKKLSSEYSIILLFDSKDHLPSVNSLRSNYSTFYDKYMVCGYWNYPNETKFCYGGVKPDGNFKFCN